MRIGTHGWAKLLPDDGVRASTRPSNFRLGAVLWQQWTCRSPRAPVRPAGGRRRHIYTVRRRTLLEVESVICPGCAPVSHMLNAPGAGGKLGPRCNSLSRGRKSTGQQVTFGAVALWRAGT
eukprot:3674914-Pyramimonas_sp.AAC.1